jgi:hypothetical protein
MLVKSQVLLTIWRSQLLDALSNDFQQSNEHEKNYTKYFVTKHEIEVCKTWLDFRHYHHHQLQGSGFLTYSDLRVSRIDSSISLVVDLCLFFLEGGIQTASEEFDKLTFLKYVLGILMILGK